MELGDEPTIEVDEDTYEFRAIRAYIGGKITLGDLQVSLDLGRAQTDVLPVSLPVGAVFAERGGLAVRNQLALTLGAASYSIYLLHPIVIGQVLKVPPTTPPASWATCIAATAASVAVSVAFYRWIEAPLLVAMRRRLGDGSPQTATAATHPSAE